ncbi:MAG: C-terminal target protein, partial [Segetibacter sp.]|nr:C-terminal target protein [Segetibacter sp.]
MKSLKINFALLILILTASFKVYGVNYVSAGAGPAAWNVATSWIPNGIPAPSDNVTIQAGHTIQLSANSYCKDLTVNGTLSWISSATVAVNGNYTVSPGGTESQLASVVYATVQMNTLGKTLSVMGTSSPTSYYVFYKSCIIGAGSTFTKTVYLKLQPNVVITNFGTLILNNGTVASANTTWINSTNSSLTLKISGFMAGQTFTANANGNSVILTYTTGAIPTTTSG